MFALSTFLHFKRKIFVCCRPPFRGRNHSHTYTLILKGIDYVKFPKHIHDAQHLIRKLCKQTPAERLGFQRQGVADIQKHKYERFFFTSIAFTELFNFMVAVFRWFQSFDWIALENTAMKSPYIPTLTGLEDLSNFDKYPKNKEIPPDEFGDWDANF